MSQKPQIALGDSYSLPGKVITGAMIDTFADLSDDKNPVHLDAVYAAGTWCKERIAHGALTNARISAVLGMKLPQAPNVPTVYKTQHTDFVKLVKIGDAVAPWAEVVEIIKPHAGIIKLNTWCYNQDGDCVAEGWAIVKVDPSLLK